MTVARMSRADRQAQTRRALLDAGRELFVREGFHGATLDRVAADAGYTKGAVYANFPTKADLFLAIFEERVETRRARMREIAERATSPAELRDRQMADWQRVLRDERAWSLLLLEFWVHAARDPALRDRLRELHLRIRATLAEIVGAAGGTGAGLDPEAFATAQMALGNGMNLEAFLDPDGTIPDTMERAARALYEGSLA